MMRLSTYRALWFFLLFAHCIQAQVGDSTSLLPLQELDAEAYQTHVQEVRYERTATELLPKEFEPSEEEKKKKKDRKKDDRPTSDLSFLNGTMAKLSIYILAGLILLFLLWAVLSNIELQSKDVAIVEIETDEIDDIETVDTDVGYENALAQRDYRLACRMLFLKVLQRLEATEKIRWKKEKTNRHYLREMSNDPQGSVFRDMVTTYEKVWYGNKPIDLPGLQSFASEASKFTPLKLPADG